MALKTSIDLTPVIQEAIENEIKKELASEFDKVVEDFQARKVEIIGRSVVRIMKQIKVDANESEFIVKFNAPNNY